MSCKRGLFLSTILLAQLIYVDVVEAKCRPGLMLCQRKGKREGKVRPQQHVILVLNLSY